jgi:cytoplasmic iron level regulating protein YaaA (DUF328/UPF0246 family)
MCSQVSVSLRPPNVNHQNNQYIISTYYGFEREKNRPSPLRTTQKTTIPIKVDGKKIKNEWKKIVKQNRFKK